MLSLGCNVDSKIVAVGNAVEVLARFGTARELGRTMVVNKVEEVPLNEMVFAKHPTEERENCISKSYI